MTRILLLSDSHGFLDNAFISLMDECDEIWHAGDFGSIDLYEQLLLSNKSLKGVYGNIDGTAIRSKVPLDLFWKVEDLKIYMTHIGGYPGRYETRVKHMLSDQKPDIFVCGHSHILKVIYDKKYNLLHLNPGACGREGFHKIRTALKFGINKDKIVEMGVIELGPK